MLANDPTWADRARQFSAKVKDLTEILEPERFREPRRSVSERVTYHDACHLCHAQKISKRPRELVQAIAKESYVELPEADVCCGSAGTYNLTEPAMAARLGARKAANILKTGATTVVTTNPGCLLQLKSELKRAGATNINAIHLADYLVGHLSDSSSG